MRDIAPGDRIQGTNTDGSVQEINAEDLIEEAKWKRKGTAPVLQLKTGGAFRVPYLQFPALAAYPEIQHGFSTRAGGVSTGELSTMNLSFTRGDEREKVLENFQRITEAIGLSAADLVFSHQTHTNHVRCVTEEDRGKGIFRERDYQNVDGLITDLPGLALTTFYADCVPLFFYDPGHRAIGLSHSGWRGTVSDIAGETVKAMKTHFHTDPADLITAIGPSICQNCYEVSEDVIDQVRMAYDSSLWEQLFYQKSAEKYQLNLWEACRQNLLRAGVTEDHISVTDLCTCCNPDLLYSHRASKGKRGNLAAFLSIRQDQTH